MSDTASRPLPVEEADRPGPDADTSLPAEILAGERSFAGRYRILDHLGRGSMGQVYLADDLILRRTVAIKISPDADKDLNLANWVTHENLRKVFDISDHEGPRFVSMEYIDGASLHELLARPFAQLSENEKRSFARQVCDGVAAMHAKHFVHRDLKPKNVMVETTGRVVVTDFDLVTQAFSDADRGSGTFDYLAPEQQFFARPSADPELVRLYRAVGISEETCITEQTDVYALGMMLFELFLGQPAFDFSTRDKLAKQKLEQAVTFPPEKPLHPTVKHIIGRCLHPCPTERPTSAREVSESIPEPDPSFEPDSFPASDFLYEPKPAPPKRWPAILFMVILLGLLPLVALSERLGLPNRAGVAEQPHALRGKARTVLRHLGLPKPAGEHYGFLDQRTVDQASTSGPWLRQEIAGDCSGCLLFWYLFGPHRLVPEAAGHVFASSDDPPLRHPGMGRLLLDPNHGRLRSFEAVPPREAADTEPDWAPFFQHAEVDPARLVPTEPTRAPARFADQRLAWHGPDPAHPGRSIRVEAASLQGHPISFQVVDAGVHADLAAPPATLTQNLAMVARLVFCLWFTGALVAAAYTAHGFLDQRWVDRLSAIRVALLVLGAHLVVWLLGTRHLPTAAEMDLFRHSLAWSFYAFGVGWVAYASVECYARQTGWGANLASAIRALHGRLRDPLVGRDVLVGTGFGLAAVLLSHLYVIGAGLLSDQVPAIESLGPLAWQVLVPTIDLQLEALRGLPATAAVAAFTVEKAILVTLVASAGITALHRLLGRRPRVTLGASLAAMTFLCLPVATGAVSDFVAAVVLASLWLVALLRFGLLPAAVATWTAGLLSNIPLTLDPSSWYLWSALLPLLIVFFTACYGVYFAFAGTYEWRTMLLPTTIEQEAIKQTS